MSEKQVHARKKGPGRKHKDGHKTGSKHGKQAQWKGRK